MTVLYPKEFPWDYVPESVSEVWVVSHYPPCGDTHDGGGEPRQLVAASSREEAEQWARSRAQDFLCPSWWNDSQKKERKIREIILPEATVWCDDLPWLSREGAEAVEQLDKYGDQKEHLFLSLRRREHTIRRHR